MINLKTLNTPALMGIVNVTPDSFSDGGAFFSPDAAIAHAHQLIHEGADILDIGGESTRPGAKQITPEEEISRILPVIDGLKNTGTPMSIDTRHAATMRAVIATGAVHMINDVSALTHDPDSINVIAQSDVSICLMHMQGTPDTMQRQPTYDDVVTDVYHYLFQRVEACQNAGIAPSRIFVDPGIGFGKTLPHNLALLNHIDRFHGLGAGILLGASRKSFIEKICPNTPPENRLPGSLAAILGAVQKGVNILRVHDVQETAQAINVFQAIDTA